MIRDDSAVFVTDDGRGVAYMVAENQDGNGSGEIWVLHEDELVTLKSHSPHDIVRSAELLHENKNTQSALGRGVKLSLVDHLERIKWTLIIQVKNLSYRATVEVECELNGRRTKRKIIFKSGESSDFLFELFRQRLPRNSAISTRSESQLRLAAMPAFILAVTIVATGLFSWFAAFLEPEDQMRARNKLAVWLLQTIGPTGAVIVGSVIALITVVYAIMRLRNPPK